MRVDHILSDRSSATPPTVVADREPAAMSVGFTPRIDTFEP
jgi:hypothetical protein